MSFACRLLLTTGFLAFACAAPAEQGDYKTPASMTAEDRGVIIDGVTAYRGCLAEQLMKLESEIGDPRALTDAAMELCGPALEAFDAALKRQNFSPGFRQRYIEMVKNRTAGEALKQATFIAAQKQGKIGTEKPGKD